MCLHGLQLAACGKSICSSNYATVHEHFLISTIYITGCAFCVCARCVIAKLRALRKYYTGERIYAMAWEEKKLALGTT